MPAHTQHLRALTAFYKCRLSAWLDKRTCHFISITKSFPGEFHCFSNRIFVKGLLFCLKKGNKNELSRAYSTKQLGSERFCSSFDMLRVVKCENPLSHNLRIKPLSLENEGGGEKNPLFFLLIETSGGGCCSLRMWVLGAV